MFVFFISRVGLASSYTTPSTSTNTTTGVITYTQSAFTNTMNHTEAKTLLIPISRKSYLNVTLKAENQSGCNTKVYFQKKKKGTATYETIKSLIKTSGSSTITATWSGIVDPTNYDYYICTDAHKGLFGYSAPSATVIIKPYFNLTYDEYGGQGSVELYKNGAPQTSKTSDATIEYLAGDKVYLVASASTGYMFVRWEGAVTGSSTKSVEFTMNSDKTVKAVFKDGSVNSVTLPSNSIVVNEKSVTFKWNFVSDPSGISKYQVALTQSTSQPTSNIVDVYSPTISKTFTGISSKNTYYAWVRAVDKAGNYSSWTQSSSFSPKPQAANITAAALSEVKNGNPSYKVNLTISNVDAATYILEREVSGVGNWTQIASLTYSQMSSKGFKYSDTTSLVKHNTYRYRVSTKNINSKYYSAKNYSNSTKIQNIQPQYTITGPNNNLLTKSNQQTFDINPKTDVEGDSLKFRVFYEKNSVIINSGTFQTSSINKTFDSDGLWNWWLEIEESAGTFKTTYQTSPRTLKIDTTSPEGEFIIKDRYSSKQFTEYDPTKRIEVQLSFSNISDAFSGVKKVYLWNEDNEPGVFHNLSAVLDSSNHLIQSYENEIKSGTAGVYILLEGNTTATINPIPWVLKEGTDGSRVVKMKIEDCAGNTKSVERNVKLDTTAPSRPGQFGYSHSVDYTKITFTWEANNGDGDIVEFIGNYIINGVSKTLTEIDFRLENGKAKGSTEVIVSSLEANQQVQIQIQAIDKAGNKSLLSNTFSAYTIPELGQVRFLIGGYDTNIKHYLRWELSSRGKAMQHVLEYREPGGVDFIPIYTDGNNKFVHSDLIPHETYDYRLVAINGSGDRTVGAVFSQEVPNTKPTTPVISSPTEYAKSTINFSFQEASDVDGDSPLNYYVHLGTGEEPFPRLNGLTKTGLIHNQTYTWYVEVTDNHGGINESTREQFTVDAIDPTLVINNKPEIFTNQKELSITASDDLSGVNRATYTILATNNYYNNLNVQDANINLVDQSGNLTGIIPLVEGAYSVHISVWDNAGNQFNEIHELNNLLVDQTKPTLSNISISKDFDGLRYSTGTEQIPVTFTAVDEFSRQNNLNMKLRYWFVVNKGDEIGQDGTLISLSSNFDEHSYTLKLEGDNQEYYLAMAVEDLAGNSSDIKYMGPIYVDKTPPQISLSLSGLTDYCGTYYLTDLNKLTVEPNAFDTESNISSIEYTIISTESGSAITEWSDWVSVKAVALIPGQKYRVAAKAINGTGCVSITESDEFIYDNSAPTILSLNGPINPVVKGEIVAFTMGVEERESSIIEYWLSIGSTEGSTDLTELISGNENGWIKVNPNSSQFRLEIPEVENGLYYPTLKVVNAAGLIASKNGDSFEVNNTKEKVIVDDGGPYTISSERLSAKWRYVGEKEITGYKYRIVGMDNEIIIDWQDTVKTEVAVIDLSLISGQEYRFEVQALYSTGFVSGCSLGVIVDTTPPQISKFDPSEYATSQDITFEWTGLDVESDIDSVQVAIGTDYNKTDITKGWVDVIGEHLSCDVNGDQLNLQNGMQYYLTLRLVNGAGLTTEMAGKSTRIDDTPPPAPIVQDQGDFINVAQPLEAHWTWTPVDPESGTIEYEWALLECGQDIIEANWQKVNKETKVTLNEIIQEHKKTYYFAVKAINGSGLTSIGMSDGIMTDAKAPTIPRLKLINAVNIGEFDNPEEVNYISSTDNLELWIDSISLSGITSYYYAWGEPEIVDEMQRTESTTDKVVLTNPQIQEGQKIVFAGECLNGASTLSATGYSTGVILDKGAPTITDVRGCVSNNKFIFDWDVKLSFSPIARYEVVLVPEAQKHLIPNSDSWIETGLSTNISLDGSGRPEGYYRLLVRAYNLAGNCSEEFGMSLPILLDRTKPKVNNIACSKFVDSELTARIEASDDLSGIKQYRYALGTLQNPLEYTDDDDWIVKMENTFTYNTEGISHNAEIYLSVQVEDNTGLWNEKVSEKIVVDHTAPIVSDVTCGMYTTFSDQINGINITANDPESGITHYMLGVVTEPGGEWLNNSEPKSFNDFDGLLTGLNLSDDRVYYLEAKVKNAVGCWSNIGTSNLIIVDTIDPVLTFAQAGEVIVVNTPPKTISYALTEDAEVQFALIATDGTSKSFNETAKAGDNYVTFNEIDPGTYTLKAKPIDLAGRVGEEKEQKIRVNNPPQITWPKEFNASPGEPIQFTAEIKDSDGYPVEYEWNPGDGKPNLLGVSPEYFYTQVGDYTLTLTVTDNDGGKGTASTVVKIRNTTSGSLYMDEVWSGEHHLSGKVTVLLGVNLTILPGTRVIVDGNPEETALNVEGTLTIQGGTQNVTFSSAIGTPDCWKGIYIKGQGNLEGVIIQHAIRGITIVDGANVSVSNCILQNNKVGIHVYGVKPMISNTSFLNNIWYGIKEDSGGRPNVINCLFSGNGMDYYMEDLCGITMENLNEVEGNYGNRSE